MAPRKTKSDAEKKMATKIRKAALYRRMKEDPETAALMKLKEKEKYEKKKQKKQRKLVSDMSGRELRAARKTWREHSKTYREKKKRNDVVVESNSSIPQLESASHQELPVPLPLQLPPSQTPQTSRQALAGKKWATSERKRRNQKIKDLQGRISSLKKKLEAEKKKNYRIKSSVTSNSESPGKIVTNVMKQKDPEMLRKRLLFGEVMEQEISKNAKCLKTNKSKREFTSLLVGDGKNLRKYGLISKCASVVPPRALGKILQNSSDNPSTMKMIHSRVKEDVGTFLEEDENSKCLPGKKDSISRGGEKKQKRLLLADMKELHSKFNARSGYEISYSSFCRFRPFWIVFPDVSKRDTCLCKTHANFGLILESLHRAKVIRSRKLGTAKKQVCCDPPTLQCYHRKCSSCKDHHILFGENGEFDGAQIVTLYQWTTTDVQYFDHKTKKMKQTKRTFKQATEKPLIEVVRELEKSVDNFLEHEGNIFHQYHAIKYLKETLEPDEILIHCDFSENYSTKYSSEIQAIHFGGNRQAISLHTVVVYMKSGEGVLPFCLCTVSSSLEHGAGAIWAHLKPVFTFINSQVDQITRVHFLSDGPSTQYRNKSIFYLLQYRLRDFFPFLNYASWNYSEAGHGKGAPDGVGGTIKRTADKLVAQGNDILNVESLIQALSKKLENVLLFQVDSSSIQGSIESLPHNVSAFKGSMKVHQAIWRRGVEHLEMKSLSCFACQYRRHCKHHTIGQHVSRPSELEDNHHADLEPRTVSPVEPSLPQHPYNTVSEQETLLTQIMSTDDIIELQDFADLDTNQSLRGSYEMIESSNPLLQLPKDLVHLVNDCPFENCLETVETSNANTLPPNNHSVLSGLCYHCGGSISAIKKGLKCEVCEKIVFHEACKVVTSCSSNDEQPPFECCQNCISLFYYNNL